MIIAISVQLGEEDEKILRHIVKEQQTTISAYIRQMIEDKIEEEIDKKLYQQALKKIEADDYEELS